MGIRILTVLAISGALGLTGCGSDDNQSAEGKSVYKGSIASISANSQMTINTNGESLTFDIGAATVDSDSDSDLSAGKMVTVEGSHDGNIGNADRIEYDSEVEGIVTANTIAVDNTGSMLVMGQVVIVDDMTMYGDGIVHASDIMVGKPVEVSGIFQADDSILAKHIEYKTNDEIEIKGIIASLAVVGDITTFDIGVCTITVDADTIFNDLMTSADLVDGAEVEVHSTAEPTAGMLDMTNGCNVTAVEIELESAMEPDLDNGIEFEFEKAEVVSALVEGRFTLKIMNLQGMPEEIVILVNADTQINNNASADDIVIGAMMRVRGIYNADDLRLALEIEFKSMMDTMPRIAVARINAYVDAVDATASTITVLGQMIMVTDITMIDVYTPPVMPETPVQLPALVTEVAAEIPASNTLADIAVGDYVVVTYERDAADMLIAIKLIVEPGVIDDPSRIKGKVTAVDAAADTVSVEGIMISGATMLQAGLVLTTELVGAEAVAEGTFAGGVFTAQKLEVAVPELISAKPGMGDGVVM